MIQVFKPGLGKEEIQALTEIFETGWIGLGPKTAEFEKKFAEFTGAKYAIAVNSATAALHLSCLALGIGPGDEVLVPAITFISTAHAPSYCGAIPVFVDVDPVTLNISIEDMKRKITNKTRAVIPVHFGGHPALMSEIAEVAQEHGLFVIEDAAHACGSKYHGKSIGNLSESDTTCFSFQAVKNLPVGDGGMITTNRVELVRLLNQLRWMGIDKSTWDRTEEINDHSIRSFSEYGWYYEIQELGYKYHMNDIAATIGLIQLKKLESANERREAIARKYDQAFEGVGDIQCPVLQKNTKSSWHNYVIKTAYRDQLNLRLKEKGIATGVHYMPLHLQPFYRRQKKVVLPQAEQVWTQLLTLPLYPELKDEEIGFIISSIKEIYQQFPVTTLKKIA